MQTHHLEFRCCSDDAWYDVTITLRSQTLTVKYNNFFDVFDEKYNVKDFKTLQEVESFEKRFRPVSVQLQDCECKKVTRGMLVCASLSVKGTDIRYFDAFVEEVKYSEHSFINGEEQCLCKFLLLWQHGPTAGYLTSTDIGKVCLIQSNTMLDPRVAAFIKLSKDKVENSLIDSSGMLKDSMLVCKDGSRLKTCGSSVEHESRPEEEMCKSSHRMIQELEGGMSNDHTEQDTDMGSELFTMKKFNGKYHHSVVVDNLEKDLSPSTVVQFIHKETNIVAQAYVFPSLSSESFTRAVIVVDSKDEVQKIYDFLVNHNLMIVSSKGRPWVTLAKFSELGSTRTSIQTIVPNCAENIIHSVHSEDELKVILSGTQEYETSKQLRDLFMEFSDHQKLMHKELTRQESIILKRA